MPNYAIKGTAVGTLLKSFASGSTPVPYFGCWALMTTPLCKSLVILQLTLLVACATSGSISGAPETAPTGDLPMSENALAIYSHWPGFRQGVNEAKDSIARGEFIFRSYGLAVISEPEPKYNVRYGEFLEKHGVVTQNQGCELDNTGTAEGYNHTIAVGVLEKYGSDFWQRADAYARDMK